MKLKTAIKSIYGNVSIYDSESSAKVGSIKSYREMGYMVIKADADKEEIIYQAISKALDRQVKEISAFLGKICIYLK